MTHTFMFSLYSTFWQLSCTRCRCNVCINIWICDRQRGGNILPAENGWHPLISQCAKGWAAQMRCFVHVSASHGEGSSSTHDLSKCLCCYSFRLNLTLAIFYTCVLCLPLPHACEISPDKLLLLFFFSQATLLLFFVVVLFCLFAKLLLTSIKNLSSTG